MKVLKTIVATAVIVFALTSVAMAGVQHFTKQSGQATGTQAQAGQPTSTITLTAAQLAQLIQSGRAVTTDPAHHARQTQHQARRTQRHVKAVRHQTSSHHAGDATHASAGGTGGAHHYEPAHHAYSSGSSTGSHHAETGHHSSDHSGGGGCGD